MNKYDHQIDANGIRITVTIPAHVPYTEQIEILDVLQAAWDAQKDAAKFREEIRHLKALAGRLDLQDG